MTNKSEKQKNKKISNLTEIPFQYVLPTFMTLIGLFFGLTSIKMAYDGRFEAAVAFVFIAAIFDGLDGRVARLLHGSSKFGAEIDSLSDFACFGIAPAFIIYFWSLNTVKPFGWLVCLLYAVCMVLRLARFNTLLDDDETKKQTAGGKYFMGVPAPSGAVIVLFPLMLSFEFDLALSQIVSFIILWTLLVAILLVSSFRTVSLKKLKIQRKRVIFYLIGITFVFGGILNRPWLTLISICFGYLLLMPFTYFKAKSLIKNEQNRK